MTFLFAGALIVAAIVLLAAFQTGLWRTMLWGALRTFLQVLGLGLVIGFVFGLESFGWQVLYVLAMAAVGGWTASRKCRLPGALPVSVGLLAVGAWLSLAPLLALGVIPPQPHFVIPLGGIFVGNGVTALTLALERIESEVRGSRDEVEGLLCMGATPRQASRFVLRRASRTGMTPLMNSLKIVGLIQIPGAMTGMLMAGASPLEAAKLQIIVMYGLALTISFAVTGAVWLSLRLLFAPAARLRRLNRA